jgi:hypothetical protein
MSHQRAPYAPRPTVTALTLPAYTLPSPIEQAQWSEARLGQECGLWLAATYPAAYAVFFHIPNGGLRTAVESHGFKMQHAKAGVPDYLLAMPRHIEGYWLGSVFIKSHVESGLFVELKTRTGRVAPAQLAWHAALRQQGYRCEVVRSLPEFITLLTEYLA